MVMGGDEGWWRWRRVDGFQKQEEKVSLRRKEKSQGKHLREEGEMWPDFFFQL